MRATCRPLVARCSSSSRTRRRSPREEMGSEAFDRARGAASRGGAEASWARCSCCPASWARELDSVDRSGDADRIWINFFNLIRGRIDELELTAEGKPAKPGVRVRTAGVHRATYLPLILDLDTRWQVQPFAFDWRELDRPERETARRRDQRIRRTAGPCTCRTLDGRSRRLACSPPLSRTWKAMRCRRAG